MFEQIARLFEDISRDSAVLAVRYRQLAAGKLDAKTMGEEHVKRAGRILDSLDNKAST